MPLLDHFRLPTMRRLPWRTLHAGWLSQLATRLNETLPPGYVALESVQVGGRFEIDVATYEDDAPGESTNGASVGTVAAARTWTPPAASGSFATVFQDVHELRVYDSDAAGTLVAAIELVSPANKDREAARKAFAAKCADYLGNGASVIVLDVVTVRRANLHNEVIKLLEAPADLELPESTDLYAAAYRPVVRDEKTQIDVWTTTFKVGDALPTMPLRLTEDLFVPAEFEVTYTETCRQRRLYD